MTELKWYSAFLLLLLFACGSETGQKEEAMKPIITQLFANNQGLFRDASIGQSYAETNIPDSAEIIQNTDSLIQYELDIQYGDSSSNVTVYYTFDDFGLFEIQVDVFPRGKEAAAYYMNLLEDELSERFGDYNRIGAVKRWTTASPSNNRVEISLSNETADYGEPFISLNFLEPLEEEV
ncbi:MAG: hypothetical protein ABR574_07570 [Cryomorphaceae bacterium]|nr:hypothetical protein [Flavobacteriales bacterium]